MNKTMLLAFAVVAIGIVLILASFFPSLYRIDICNTFLIGGIIVQYPCLISGILCCSLGILRMRRL